MEGSHSGQLRGTRNPEGAIPTQVQILYPPHMFCPRSLTDKIGDSGSSAVGSIPAEGADKY